MRALTVLVLLLSLAVPLATAAGSQDDALARALANASMDGNIHGTLDIWFGPKTLEDVKGSTLILIAKVKTVLPSRLLSSTKGPDGSVWIDLETDVLLDVERVIRGANPGPQLAVTELGGRLDGRSQTWADFTPMRDGERFVLFLAPSSGNRPAIPSAPRFNIVGKYVGALRLTGDRVEGRAKIPNQTLEQLLERIQ